MGCCNLKNHTWTGSPLPQFVFRMGQGELLDGVRRIGGMNNQRAALRSALRRVSEIPERDPLDVKVASPAIHQMNLQPDPGLPSNLCFTNDLVRTRKPGRIVRSGNRAGEDCQSSDHEQAIASSNHSPPHMIDRPSFTRFLTPETLT